MPRVEQITYFENTTSWRRNTAAVVDIVARELKLGRIEHVVLATATGYTGSRFAPLAKAHPKVRFVGVKMAPAIDAMYDVKWNQRYGKMMDEAGISWFGGTHALTGGVDHALRTKFQGYPPSAVIAETLYLFSQGMKVCVEIISMACDAGRLPEGVPVIACAGTGSGSDTAIIASSAASANLFELRIHRILAMPMT